METKSTRGGRREGSGRKALKDKRIGFTAQYPPELLERARITAKRDGITVSDLLVKALQSFFKPPRAGD